MILEKSEKTQLAKAIFDALPSMIFVVDEDARIYEYNEAAKRLFGASRNTVLQHRTGDILHCLHSTDNLQGCGRAPACKDCIVRNAIREAFQGAQVVRRRSRIQLNHHGEIADIFALITASPFSYQEKPLVLLVIEDIKDISELQELIPICCVCRKIRNDKESWVALETYFKNQWDTDFTHCYCPDCRQREMEKIKLMNQAG